MTIDRRKALTHLALLPIAAAPVAWAQPADYPNRPVRVVVTFDGDLEKLDFEERAHASRYRALTGRDMPYATLMYVWDGSGHEPESVHRNHRTARIQYLTVESGAARAGRGPVVRGRQRRDLRFRPPAEGMHARARH